MTTLILSKLFELCRNLNLTRNYQQVLKNNCKGRLYNKDFSANAFNTTRGTQSYFEPKTALAQDQIAFPCGYLASSFPGDRFQQLEDASGNIVPIIVDDNLNMKGSENTLWKDGENQGEKLKEWTSVEDPLFRNWMVNFHFFA